jgi:lipoprotein-anchoring transpeptidase ErfK/SrfK
MTLAIVLAAATVGLAQSPAPSSILDAQVQLDRVGFSPGEIDGAAGANFERAVSAFQRAHRLEPTGRLDPMTQQRLGGEAGAEPALLTYELTPADVAGPFTAEIPDDLVAQARLKRLDYRSPLETLGEKFHASPRLLQRLNSGSSFSRAGERVMVPNVGRLPESPEPSAVRVRIVVRTATSSLTVEDEQGVVLFQAPVTSGSEHDPLPIGRYTVTGVQRLPTFNYNPDLFWDADPGHSKARIPPGPNNPVGTTWIDLSKEHYGIHGTPEPSSVGHAQSHGCVRLTNWDVERVSRWARPGTVVIFE